MDERGLLDLMIVRIPGLCPRERVSLVKKFDKEADLSVLSRGDIDEILNRSPKQGAKLPPEKKFWAMDSVRAQADRDAAALRLRGMAYVSIAGTAYPPQLREIFDPPPVLFYRGVLPRAERALTAVVGTRRPSSAAQAAAFALAGDLARRGFSVVSGLALGIDAMAHRGNIEGGAPSFAVLGSSADEVYPASNRALARRLIETGGALLSEYPPGTGPMKWHFPARNRIISALARGTVVVEAPASSGALITAQFALDQGRDLWVTAAGVASPRGEGTRKLAEDGAGIIGSASDIFREWGFTEQEQGTGDNREGAAKPAAGAALASSLARSLNFEL